MRRTGKAIGTLAAATSLALLGGGLVQAAELVTAELDGTANSVGVTAGSSSDFTISLTATGQAACGSSHTAKVPTRFSVSTTGGVTSVTTSVLSEAKSFTTVAGDSTNCAITWASAPTAMTVAAQVTVAAGTPAGTYSVAVPGTLTNSNQNGGKLEDQIATTLQIVVAAATTSNAAPTVAAVVNGANATAGTGDWYKAGSVGLSWTITGTPTPTLNTSIAAADCGAKTVNTDGQHSFTCAVTNAAGNAQATATIKRDATPPTATVSGPTAGATYVTPPTVTCTSLDSTSGIATDATVAGDGSALGLHTVSCAGAVDRAGNAQTAASNTISYTLVGIDQASLSKNFDGLSVPKAKAGSSIPLGWAFTDGANRVQSITRVTITSAASSLCFDENGSTLSEVAEVTAGGSGLQLLADGSYQVNWKSSTTTGCRRVTVNMFNGPTAEDLLTSRSALINFTK